MPWRFLFSDKLYILAIELNDNEFICSSQAIRSMREGVALLWGIEDVRCGGRPRVPICTSLKPFSMLMGTVFIQPPDCSV